MAKDFMILDQEGVKAFKASWTGVLRFLFESAEVENYLQWILQFLKDNPDSLDELLSDVLTTIDPGRIAPDLKNQIFDLIYDTYYLGYPLNTTS